MRHETFNMIRVALLITLILAMIAFCMIDAKSMNTQTNPPEAPTTPQATESTTTIKETTPTEIPETVAAEPPTEQTEPPTEPQTEYSTETVSTVEPTTEPTEAKPSYTKEELEMLALVIYQEAGSDVCSDETRLMVGTVVMNRVADDRFPDTMYEVLTEEGQYGELYWTGIVWPKKSTYSCEIHAVERAYDIAERILMGERAFSEDVVWQAEFVQGTEVVAHQDGLYFCR